MHNLDQIGIDSLVTNTNDIEAAGSLQCAVKIDGVISRRSQSLGRHQTMSWREAKAMVKDGYVVFGFTKWFQWDIWALPSGDLNLKVQTSLAGFFNEHNLYVKDLKGDREAVDALEDALRNLGIKTNLQNARLSDLHLTRTVPVTYSYLSYRPVFDVIHLARMKRLPLRREYSSVGYGNGQIEVIFYEKGWQLNGAGHTSVDWPPHMMRGEMKLKTHHKIRSTLHAATVRQLWDVHGDIPLIYTGMMEKTVFSLREQIEHAIRQGPPSQRDFAEELNRVVPLSGPRDPVKKCAINLGMSELIDRYGYDHVCEVIRQRHKGNKSQISRRIQEFRQAQQFYSLRSAEPDQGASLLTLFDELKEKFTSQPIQQRLAA